MTDEIEFWKQHGGRIEQDGPRHDQLSIERRDFDRFVRELRTSILSEKWLSGEATPEGFVKDWDMMVATVSTLAKKHNMPKPQMVFHPQWLQLMNAMSNVRLAPTIIYMDVKIRFGMFEPADVLRIA